MSNRGSSIIILAVYIAASALAFQYGFHIAIDRHYTDLRKYITPIGRGCGVCLDLQCALLLLPMLRALLTKLRQTKCAPPTHTHTHRRRRTLVLARADSAGAAVVLR